MKRKILFWAVAFALGTAEVHAQQWPAPRQEAKAGSRWWWLGSAVDEQNLRWNMEQYGSHGIGALEITPLYGVQGNDANNVPFLSPRWMELLKYTQALGRDNGIQIDMNMGTGWPFGGPEVTLADAACKVVLVDSVVDARQADNLVLPPPCQRTEIRAAETATHVPHG